MSGAIIYFEYMSSLGGRETVPDCTGTAVERSSVCAWL